MKKGIHACCVAKRTVPFTDVLSQNGSKSIKAWYAVIAALCGARNMFS